MTDSAPLRADAQARRRRLVATASRLFADEGLDVPMQRIAQEAGVGVGTLYRRFPDRTSLLVAVVSEDLRHMRDGIRGALASEGSAWDAFIATLERRERNALAVRSRLTTSPSIGAEVRADPDLREMQREVGRAMAEVVAAAQAEGSMRPDVGSGDVALLLYLFVRRTVPDGAPEGTSGRLQALILDALATGPRSDLPGSPVTMKEVWDPT